MMEEVGTHDEARITDALQDAAQTYVTQASTARAEASSMLSSPSSVSAFSPATGSLISTPSPLPMGGIASPSAPPPPTSGFVPSHGVVTATPPSKFHSPVPAQSGLVGSSPHPNVFTPVAPPAPTTQGVDSRPFLGSPAGYSAPHGCMGHTTANIAPPPYAALSGGIQIDLPPATSPAMSRSVSESSEPAASKPEPSGGGIFGWLQGGGSIVHKMLEKTKSSVETMITTLDPGMKEVMLSGGDINIIVTSTKESKVGAVRQAFQEVFGRATVTGVESQPDIAPQPVGWTAGLKGAEERLEKLRRLGTLDDSQPVISIESFIVELLPDRWFDVGCVLLRDRARRVDLQTFTQATPLPLAYVQEAHDRTPGDYGLRWSGLSVTVGQIMSERHPGVNHADWHEHVTNGTVTRRDLVYLACRALAGMYQIALTQGSQQGAL